EALEAGALDEVEEVLELLLGLAGESDDESGADRDAGNAGANPGDEILDVLAAGLTAHHLEHARVNVLQRHVDVSANLVARGDGGDELIAPVGRVRVKEADPEIAFDLLQFVEQVHERDAAGRVDLLARPGFFLPEVHAEVGGVLGDEVDLL